MDVLADRNQAKIVFNVAKKMVELNKYLKKAVKISESKNRIEYKNSFYQVLSAEAYSKHGFNIHGVVFDELHAQPNRKLYDVMTKGSGDARKQPLFFLLLQLVMIQTLSVMKYIKRQRISWKEERLILHFIQ